MGRVWGGVRVCNAASRESEAVAGQSRTAATMAALPPGVSERDVIDRYGRLRQELASLLDRAADLESEAAEHGLVAATLEPMEGGRKCFRLVRGGRGGRMAGR